MATCIPPPCTCIIYSYYTYYNNNNILRLSIVFAGINHRIRMWHHSRSEVKEGGDEDETANRCTHIAQRVPASTENEKENMEQ